MNLFYKSLVILVLGLSGYFCAYSQSREIDSLKKILATQPADTNKVVILNKLARAYFNYDFQDLKSYSDQALSLAKQLNYKKGRGVAYTNLAISYMLVKGDTTALNYLYKALAIFKAANDNVNIAVTLNKLGCYFATIKDHPQAIIYFKQALQQLNSRDKEVRMIVLGNIGSHYEDVGQYQLARRYYDTVFTLSKQLHDINHIANSYLSFASLSYIRGDYAQAINYCKQGLALAQKNDLGTREIKFHYMVLGNVYYKLKNFDKARAYYRAAAAQEQKLNSTEDMAEIYHDFYLLDSVKGDNSSALKNYLRYSLLKDSLVNVDKNRLIAMYQVKFGVERRDEENTRLKIVQGKNKTIIRKQRTILALVLLSLLMISGGFIYLKKINSEVKRQNKVIHDQNIVLENNNKVKDTIFSVISHDLRTPVTQFIGLLDLWDDGDIDNEELAALMPSVKNNSLNTLELLDNLLIWSKKQLQGFDFNPVLFDISGLTDFVLNKLQPVITQKGVAVSNEIPPSTMAFADQEMVTAIIRNLIANAVKFTPAAGTVNITGEVKGAFVIICVADTGVGIKPSDIEKILSLNTHTTLGTANEKGTGIGLRICQDFVKLNNGELWIESEENKGSRFYISLPVTAGAQMV